MSKLLVDKDAGLITIPLKGRDPVVIDEPGMIDLAWLTDEVQKLDNALPKVEPVVVAGATAEQLEQFQEQNNARTVAIYGQENGLPYATLLIEFVKRVTDGAESIAPEQLPSWAPSPAVVRTILETFRAPLPGEA